MTKTDEDYSWIFTKTCEDAIPKHAPDEHVVDIDRDGVPTPVEAFTYNTNTDSLVVRTYHASDSFNIFEFNESDPAEYQELRKLGQTGDDEQFYEWFYDNIVDPEPNWNLLSTCSR